MLKYVRKLSGVIAAIALISLIVLTSIHKNNKNIGNVKRYGYTDIDEYLSTYLLDKEAINLETFQLLSDGFAFDDKYLYIKKKKFPYQIDEDIQTHYQEYIKKYLAAIQLSPSAVDLKTFRIIRTENQLSADNTNVYYKNQIFEIADAETIKGFGSLSGYIIDKNLGYCFFDDFDKQILPEIDYETFHYLGVGYALDDNYVYYNCQRILDADPKTFRFYNDKKHLSFQDDYAYDQNYVYIGDRIVHKADPKTFQSIEKTYYAKDKSSIYYRGMRINNSDPNTFELIVDETSQYDAKDRNYLYVMGIPQI